MAPPAKLHPLPSFLSSPTPIHDPGSLAYRFVARPLLWTVGRLNPFGGGETVEKEEAIWKRVKGKEYVHLALLEVSRPSSLPQCCPLSPVPRAQYRRVFLQTLELTSRELPVA